MGTYSDTLFFFANGPENRPVFYVCEYQNSLELKPSLIKCTENKL